MTDKAPVQYPAEHDRPGISGLAFWTRLVVFTFVTVAGLVLGASVFIPLAIALLLVVLISAIVDHIRSREIAGRPVPNWVAHLVAIGLVLFGLLSILSILSGQANAVAEAFPRYEQRFFDFLARIAALVGDQNYAAAQQALSELNVSDFVGGALTSAGAFLSGLLLVAIYVPFMLVERDPMRKKLALAAPDPQVQAKLHVILDSMSNSLQRYIGIKTLVSVITGVGSYAFMKPVGLDFAETWAVLAFALNFIPTIGSIIGAALPSIVALVQFDTFGPFLIVAGGCASVQFVVGNILEPSITGRSLNLSPFMVILSLTFWTAIWGISGALLSVPITVCMLIVMSHLPATRPVAVLMSGDGRLISDPETPTKEEA